MTFGYAGTELIYTGPITDGRGRRAAPGLAVPYRIHPPSLDPSTPLETTPSRGTGSNNAESGEFMSSQNPTHDLLRRILSGPQVELVGATVVAILPSA